MIIYGSPLSPYVRKIVIYCAERGIELDMQPGGLGAGGPEFLEASPFKKIPAIRDGDFTLADSSAIAHYLETKHGQALIPTEAEAVGRTIWLDEFTDTILIAAAGAVFFNRIVAPKFLKQEGDMAAAEKAEKETLPPLFEWLNGEVQESGYLVGDGFTLADVSVASSFINLLHCGIEVDAEKYPKLRSYIDAIWARPSFAAQIEREQAMFRKG